MVVRYARQEHYDSCHGTIVHAWKPSPLFSESSAAFTTARVLAMLVQG